LIAVDTRIALEINDKGETEISPATNKSQMDSEAAKLKAENDKARVHAEIDEVMAALSAFNDEEEPALTSSPTPAPTPSPTPDPQTSLQEMVQFKKSQQVDSFKPRASGATSTRSTIGTVLFFDVVGYTKQPVNKQNEIKTQFNSIVTDCLDAQEDMERIILDTGDGAAIGFLQHPEDALEVAIQFRKTVTANQHKDYPELNVRIGIHLGPINVVKDMNGQNNMVGDGINDAQRVMSFAGIDQVFISRTYYDFISRLNDEYAALFQYRGLKKDKHGREHQVYELAEAKSPSTATTQLQSNPLSAVKLEAFSFAMTDTLAPSESKDVKKPEAKKPEVKQTEEKQSSDFLMEDFSQFIIPEILPTPAPKAPAPSPAPAAPTIPEFKSEPILEPTPPVYQPPTPPANAPKQSPSTAPTPTSAPTPAATPAASSSTVDKLQNEQASKPVAKANVPSAEEIKKFAETQAKAWAEAQKRSTETIKATAQPVVAPHESNVHETPRRRRKPISWSKIFYGLFASLLIAIFVLPSIMPMKGFTPQIEQILSQRLNQPVHVSDMKGRLLPTPRFEFDNVTIGKSDLIQAQKVRVDFALSALFSAKKPVTGIEMTEVMINGAGLPEVSDWLLTIASDANYPVASITLKHGTVEAEGFKLEGLDALLSFDPAGNFMQATIHNVESKLAMEINYAADDKITVNITASDSALPMLPNWSFDSLTAKGELNSNSLVISDINGRIFGGEIHGNTRLDWSSGWIATGSLTASGVGIQNINEALSGQLDGNARFQMKSANLTNFVDSSTMDGSISVKKGVIVGVDIVATARQRSTEILSGGRTHFDELESELFYSGGNYRLKNIKIDSGVMTATGLLDISKQQLSGRIAADLSKFAGMGGVALQIGGTTDKPTLRTAK
jgi:class 3 adenylate cyclase